MLGNTKSPVSFVTAGADFVPRASLISTTVAPGMTPPCSSRTLPEMVPVVICPNAAVDASMHVIKSTTTLLQVLCSIDSSWDFLLRRWKICNRLHEIGWRIMPPDFLHV